MTELWPHRALVRPTPDARLCDLSVVALDTETTGRSAELGHRITEIAIVGRDVGEHAFDIDDETRFEEHAQSVLALLESRLVVGHNVTFDLKFVASEISRLKELQLPTLYFADTMTLAQRVGRQTDPVSLDELAASLDAEPGGRRHQALVDARLVFEVFEELTAVLDNPTLADIGMQRLNWSGRTT